MESKTPEECRRCIHGEVCRYVHVEKPEPCVFRNDGAVHTGTVQNRPIYPGTGPGRGICNGTGGSQND